MSTPKLLLVFLLNAIVLIANEQKEKECIILNREYPKGFLYDKYLYTPYYYTAPRTYAEELPSYFDQIERGQWILQPIPNRNNTYLIKNKKFNEYLYAMDKLFNYFYRRDIGLGKLKNIDQPGLKFKISQIVHGIFNEIFDRPQSAWWEIKKQPNNWYQIWNVEFKERNFFTFI